MIEINLLPVREARRAADLRQQFMQLLLVLILVAGGVAYVHSRISSEITSVKGRIVQMESDIKQFQPQLDQVAAFRKKKANLEKKIDVIDGLDRARKGPVRIMHELAAHTPKRLWLTNLTTKGTALTLSGQSLDNELVASLLHALNESPYFSGVDLNNTKLTEGGGGLKVVKFALQAVLENPKPKKSADAKGAAKPS
jgi:type IV pilus assembly protein PilN